MDEIQKGPPCMADHIRSQSAAEDSDSVTDISRLPKAHKRTTKRSRTSSWTNLAQTLTTKVNHTSIPSAPGSPLLVHSTSSPRIGQRRPSIALVTDPAVQKELIAGLALASVEDKREKLACSLNSTLDNMFTGMRYDPEPVTISQDYNDPSWKPVQITEESVGINVSNFDPSHEDQPFYHGELSRDDSLKMFERHGKLKGLCVVRDSTRTPGQYTLTVWDGNTSVNYRIELNVPNSNAPGQYLLSGKTPFRSIAEILVFLKQNSQFFPTAPQMFIPKIPDSYKDYLYSRRFVPGK